MTKIILDPASEPASIEARSFEIIENEIPEPRPWTGDLWTVARRCVHALGDPEIISSLVLNEDAFKRGLEAIRAGTEIIVDTMMLKAGLVRRRMEPLGIQVRALMETEGIDRIAKEKNITRSAAAIRLLAQDLDNKIIAIGNAPTALLGLLNELALLKERGVSICPALVIGMPVGFVNAAQSKLLLASSGLPYFTLNGYKGGSAAAAACINALADIVLKERQAN